MSQIDPHVNDQIIHQRLVTYHICTMFFMDRTEKRGRKVIGPQVGIKPGSLQGTKIDLLIFAFSLWKLEALNPLVSNGRPLVLQLALYCLNCCGVLVMVNKKYSHFTLGSLLNFNIDIF